MDDVDKIAYQARIEQAAVIRAFVLKLFALIRKVKL